MGACDTHDQCTLTSSLLLEFWNSASPWFERLPVSYSNTIGRVTFSCPTLTNAASKRMLLSFAASSIHFLWHSQMQHLELEFS